MLSTQKTRPHEFAVSKITSTIASHAKPGEYEARVRGDFDSALNVPNYLWIYDVKYLNIRVMEGKALLQERLFELGPAQS